MSFRLFIYYCALCGGAAALLGWMLGRGTASGESLLGDAVKAFWLGLAVAGGLGLVDALWNLSLRQFKLVCLRVLTAMAVGGLGGFVGGLIGRVLFHWTELQILLVFGWTFTGLLI